MIYKATIDDTMDIYELEKETFQEDSYSCEEIETLITHKCRETFVIRDSDYLIGYISFNLYECQDKIQPKQMKRLYIQSLCINSKYRKQGFGRQLMEYADLQANMYKCESIYLHVKQSNKIAQELYKSCGFTISCILKNYYKKEDGFMMSKSLKG